MKNYFSLTLCLLVSIFGVGVTATAGAPVTERLSRSEVAQAQPKLLRITAMVDGSGRIVFTRNAVYYEHKHWSEPTDVTFDGEAWNDLTETPGSWHYIATHYDLTRAYILKRQGRDVVALEQTPDGFDLYLCDSPNGAAHYEVVISLPPRP